MLAKNAESLKCRLLTTPSHNIVHVNILPELTQKRESICGDKSLSEDTQIPSFYVVQRIITTFT
jgi:hypothetical protein